MTEGGSREHWSNEYAFAYSTLHDDWLLKDIKRDVTDRDTGEHKQLDLTVKNFGTVVFGNFDPSTQPKVKRKSNLKMSMHRTCTLLALLTSCLLLSSCGHITAREEMIGTPPELTVVGKHWQEKLDDGMAVLIFAIPQPKFAQKLSSIDYRNKEFSADTAWYDENGNASKGIDVLLHHDQFDDIAYRMMMVPAGTYHLRQVLGDLRNTRLDKKIVTQQPPSLGVGIVDYAEGTYSSLGHATVWKDPAYTIRRTKEYVCDFVIGGTSQCVSGHSVLGTEKIMTDAGGYREITTLESGHALELVVSLKRPLASITLAPGEVVLTDGVAVQLPGVRVGDQACVSTKQNVVRCELSAFEFETFPANIEDYRKSKLKVSDRDLVSLTSSEKVKYKANLRLSTGNELMGVLWDSPVSDTMHNVLNRAKYKPLQVQVSPTDRVPTWGGRSYGVFSEK